MKNFYFLLLLPLLSCTSMPVPYDNRGQEKYEVNYQSTSTRVDVLTMSIPKGVPLAMDDKGKFIVLCRGCSDLPPTNKINHDQQGVQLSKLYLSRDDMRWKETPLTEISKFINKNKVIIEFQPLYTRDARLLVATFGARKYIILNTNLDSVETTLYRYGDIEKRLTEDRFALSDWYVEHFPKTDINRVFITPRRSTPGSHSVTPEVFRQAPIGRICNVTHEIILPASSQFIDMDKKLFWKLSCLENTCYIRKNIKTAYAAWGFAGMSVENDTTTMLVNNNETAGIAQVRNCKDNSYGYFYFSLL